MRPSIIVDKWGIKTNSLLGYAVTTDDFYVAREFSYTRAGTTPGTLINASGNLVNAVLNTPRIDYTGGSPSLLVEPAATNFIPNSSMSGTYVGGFPPFWFISSAPGITTTVTPAGTVNGINYIDVSVGGTSTSSGFYNLRINASNAAIGPTTVGQQYTGSIYLALLSGNLPVAPTGYVQIQETNSTGGGGGTGSVTNFALSLSSQLTRYFGTHTVTQNAGLTHINMRWGHALTNGVFYSYTIRIGIPQLELGAIATSPIRTTTAPLTRDADVCTFSNASSLIGQTEGTLYAEVDVKSSSTGSFISIDVGSGADFILISKFSNFTIVVQLKRASGSVANIITSSAVSIGVHKIALSYTNGNYALYIDGVSAGTSTNSTDYPASTLTRCGLSNTSYGIINDRIRAAAVYTSRLSNDNLMLLTLPTNDGYLPTSIWNYYLSKPGVSEVSDCLYERYFNILNI